MVRHTLKIDKNCCDEHLIVEEFFQLRSMENRYDNYHFPYKIRNMFIIVFFFASVIYVDDCNVPIEFWEC